MSYTSLVFDGMVCDNDTGLPIGGAQCQIIGGYGHTTNADPSNSSDGGFLCVNSGAPGNAFWMAQSANDEPSEELFLWAEKAGYEPILGLPVGSVPGYQSPGYENGNTYWMKGGAPSGEPQSAEDLGLSFQTEPLKTAPVIGAPQIAWVGEWESTHHPAQLAWVYAAIMLKSGAYTIDITDRIVGDEIHEEGAGQTLGRVLPSKMRLNARGAPRRARPLPGIHFLRASVRAVRANPIGVPDSIQNVLPDLSKIEVANVALDEIRQFAVKLGVLCDSLKLDNGIVLQLYGLYTAQGHNLVDYAIRYRRGGGAAPKRAGESASKVAAPLGLDLMLYRVIEPPK